MSHQNIAKKYQKKDPISHILDLPDSYIGSVESTELELWVYSKDNKKMEKKTVTISPGFYKIFDEILVNACDHHIRAREKKFKDQVTQIKVNISPEEGKIVVYNNGDGIPVAIHPEHKIYVPELIFGNLLTSENYNKDEKRIVGGKNGYGAKCISSETLIPLWNGEIKKAGDIRINDKIIGDDGRERNILNIIKGVGKLYEIEQAHGENYIVNDEHILTLHMPDHKVIFWNSNKNGYSILWWDNINKKIRTKTEIIEYKKIECEECKIELSSNLKRHYKRKHPEKTIPKKVRKLPTKIGPDTKEAKKTFNEIVEFSKTIDDNNVFDISIKEYMKLNETTKKRLAGIRGNCVEWEKRNVELDPYILGLWLGDGSQRGYRYACHGEKDPEIINYLEKWADKNDANIKRTAKYDYYISSNSNYGKKGCNPLNKLLKKYNLINNKHIPLDYIRNDRETRLKVLAGIIDTDGTVSRNGKRIVLSQGLYHKQLIEDTKYLARTLGFQVTQSIKKTSWKYKDELKKGEAYFLNISGNIGDIPTLLPRKKCSSERVCSEKTTGFLKIKDIGLGEYVGFKIDGNERFIINDFTITHNCTNIYSTKFIVETVDAVTKQKYVQEFSNNMREKSKPVITKCSSKPYTQITFYPELKRFGMEKLDNDILFLMEKRVYDISACTDKSVNVFLNDEKIECKTFEKYVDMYIGDKGQSARVYENVNERWEVVVGVSDDEEFEQISFVNGVCTYKGGKHVEMLSTQIANKLKKHMEKGRKKLVLKPEHIKKNMFLFVKSLVENANFDSQTKEYLTTPSKNFGSKCDVSDKFIEKLSKIGIVEKSLALGKHKDDMELMKTSIKKSKKIKIPKLDDANFAGTNKAKDCTLILTEGDSARATAIAGLSMVGRDYYGVFPLKGKLLNTREATAQKLLDNQEVNHLQTILGLQQYEFITKTSGKEEEGSKKKSSPKKTKKVYTDVSELRYGKILVFCDADLDGSHIKGLVKNFIHSLWPELTKIPGFFVSLATPIIKASKGKNVKKFYTLTEYNNWKSNDDVSGWKIKYYKGLGTSTAEEAKDYFKNIKEDLIEYCNEDEECDDAMLLAFAKERADDRKEWLKGYNPDDIIEQNEKKINFKQFINRELIHFSNYDCKRSIPNLCDGLKPSQRKVLFGCFKRNLRKEIKVAQLSGYISEHAAYHHGEKSLQDTIINMAQDFVGSNNINLLVPQGQFGTRLTGKDFASPRYIFTFLNDITWTLYNKMDLPVYKYLDDDGMKVEPEYYLPIIPMVLVNGAYGIGTGYSTSIPCYNPLDLMKNIKNIMEGKELEDMVPYYKGFKGKIEKGKDGKYICRGNYKFLDNTTVEITELPIEVWTENYTEMLDEFIVDSSVKDEKKRKKQKISSYKKGKNHNDKEVHFIIKIPKVLLDKYKANRDAFEKDFKLVESISTNNMHLYNSNGVISKYKNVEDILVEFYKVRMEYYLKRKTYWLVQYKKELDMMEAKAKFIEYVRDNKIDIRKDEEEVVKILEEMNFPKFGKSEGEEDDEDNHKFTYDYLLRMHIRTLTQKQMEKLRKEYEIRLGEYNEFKSKSEKDLWREDLDNFNKIYDKLLKEVKVKNI